MAAAAPSLTDVSQAAGLDFVHDPGLGGRHFMPEIMGAGVALLDCDDDGRLDVYLIDGGRRDAEPGPGNRLYRQGPGGRFVDVSAGSGLADTGYGMGATVGDVDNDGDVDVYVSNHGLDRLYLGDGDCHFTDATETAGVATPGWSSSATFADLDADGWLDLYVARYLDHDPQLRCAGTLGQTIYCGPDGQPGLGDRLYRNRGDGRFADVTDVAGVAAPGKGLGVVAFDLTADGRVDLYVANDGEPNRLWVAQGDGTYVDEAIVRGVAVNEYGDDEASMGIAVGDVDDDGHLDLLVTHLETETHTLYLWRDDAFVDATADAGLTVPTLADTGFGSILLDLDGDGDLDLAAVNGLVGSGDARLGDDLTAAFGQRDRLFENTGDGRFRAVETGDFSARREIGRGLAAGDVDGDGDLDLVVTSTAGPARLFRNDARGRHASFRVIDPALRRDALGAIVSVARGARRGQQPIAAGRSYLSSSEPIASFGLADAGRLDDIRVRWPDGAEERFGAVDAPGRYVLERGTGRARRRAAGVALAGATGAPVVPPPAAAAESLVLAPIAAPEPQVEAAIREAQDSVRADPSDAGRWARLAVVLHAHGRPQEALHGYLRALAIEDGDARLHYLAAVLLGDRDPARAIGHLEAVERRSPDFVPALIRHGHALRALGRDEAAAAKYREALARHDRSAAANLAMAQLSLGAGDLDASLRHARLAVRGAPRAAQTHRTLALVLARRGDDATAELARATAARLDDTFDVLIDPLLVQVQRECLAVGAIHRRAAQLRAQGEGEAALAELSRAVGYATDRAITLHNRALVLADLGRIDEAISDLDRSLEIDPGFRDALENRARLRLESGDRAAAERDARALLAVAPDDPEAAALLRSATGQ